ncbi:MAG: hypothetical protein GY803_23225 [Chloroflexi bacterium]|nr:hypothetical protein [Chloroflexota bacterium]
MNDQFASRTYDLPPEKVWEAALGELELQMEQATFNAWLKDARFLDAEGDTFVIGVRNEYAQDWVATRLQGTILRTLEAIMGRTCTILVTTPGSDARSASSNGHANGDGASPDIPPPPGPPREERPLGEDGYGGNLSEEQRAELLKKIAEREAGQDEMRSGGNLPDEAREAAMRRRAAGGRGETVEYRNIRKSRNPLKGFVQLSHYALRFWKPYIGASAFNLHVLISSYAYEFEALGMPGPSLKLLGLKTKGGENAIRGRKATAKTQGREGLLGVLRKYRICDHQTEGVGRGMHHFFDHLTKVEDLPLLTPKQVKTLHPAIQNEHAKWLSLHGFDAKNWGRDDRETTLDVFPRDESP